MHDFCQVELTLVNRQVLQDQADHVGPCFQWHHQIPASLDCLDVQVGLQMNLSCLTGQVVPRAPLLGLFCQQAQQDPFHQVIPPDLRTRLYHWGP